MGSEDVSSPDIPLRTNQPALTKVIATKVARCILAGFEAMFADFLNITLGAQSRFEQADWHGVQDAMRERLKVYEGRVEDVRARAAVIALDSLQSAELWHNAKGIYADLVRHHDNGLIAQTFFNSVFGGVRGHKKIRDMHLFIHDARYSPEAKSESELLEEIDCQNGLSQGLEQLLHYFKFRQPYEALSRDVGALHGAVNTVAPQLLDGGDCRIEFGRSLFFRNKAAYIIGRIENRTNGKTEPFAIALLNNENGGIFVDTIILGQGQLSMLFGYARSYFMVDSDQPVRYVNYLCQLMPDKAKFELFNAIGFIKHAKTEFYRYKVATTRRLPKSEQYEEAPGVKGMVMLVFTTPNSDYVYKVIRDRFVPPKTGNRETVMQKYDFVKNADRVGRLVDTHEFRYLAFDLSRFSDELLTVMQAQIADTMTINGNALVLQHVYVERKMTPLNLFVKEADERALDIVMRDYGYAIKQLAAANVFPGDMLMKNFGVTRWNKVVFYDYDEICPLLDCHFKTMPKPQGAAQQLAPEPWFDVGPADIFPEQFPVFFVGNQQAQTCFNQYHSDLFGVDFWRRAQQQVRDGVIADVFPYKDSWRFPRS